MVLLNSSTISVVISGGVVGTFTFLLFLSGYVLQQQTVRSLQDALRNPPERLAVPTPTLPPQFQVVHEDETHSRSIGSQQVVLSDTVAAILYQDNADEVALRSLWREYVQSLESRDRITGQGPTTQNRLVQASDNQPTGPIASKESLGYILAMPDISSLCSAVLFTKKHKNLTRLTTQPSMVYIYPANWDVSDEKSHLAAMDLLRDMQDSYAVTLHPVTISRVWAGITVEQQLVAELQRYRWPYDRAMYLGNPGMLIDTRRLDEALALSSAKASWTLLHPKPKSYEASHPSLLLWSTGRGLLYPRPDAKALISTASVSPSSRRADKKLIGQDAKDVAYVLFDEKELQQKQNGQTAYGKVFERFQRDRKEACAGAGLLNA